MFRKKLPMQGSTRSIAAKDGRKRGKQGKEVPTLLFGQFPPPRKTALCLSGAAPLKPFEHTASSRTSYPSPCRKRQVSSTPSFVLSPKSHGFSGDPFVWLRVSPKRLGAWPLLPVMLLFLFLAARILAQHPVYILLVEQQLAHLIARTPVFGIRRLFLR